MGGLLLPLLVLLAIWALSRITASIQGSYPMAPPASARMRPGSGYGAAGAGQRRPRVGMTHPYTRERDRDVVSEAIVGWKSAYVVESGTQLRFIGIGAGSRYESLDAAMCISDPSHRPPHPGCGCGFYALRERRDALKMMTTSVFQRRPRTPMLLEVELSGRVEEYERGWVGERQTVLGVEVPSSCCGCVGDPTATTLVVDQGHVVAKCAEHAGGRGMSLATLAGELGTEARWTWSPLDPRTDMLSFNLPTASPTRTRSKESLDDLVARVAAGHPEAIAEATLAIVRMDAFGRDDWVEPARRIWDALSQTDRLHVIHLAPSDHPMWDRLLRG